MENHLSVALVSGPLVPGRKDANLSMMARALGDQAAGSDLVIFAEANINGGFWKDGESDYPRLAEGVPRWPVLPAGDRTGQEAPQDHLLRPAGAG